MTLSTRSDLAFASTIDDLPVVVLRFEDGQLVAANKRWEAITGLSVEASIGSGWLSAVNRDHWATAQRFVNDVTTPESSAEWPLSSVGDRVTVWVQAASAIIKAGTSTVLLVVLTEIDGHKAIEAGLLHRASHDSLTGLLNRGAFMTAVSDACERASVEFGLCALLYLDLDRFKDVNDQLGHLAGDRVLAAVGRRLRSSLRPTDLLARLGGDEMGVLCPVLQDEAEAIQLAERIVRTVGQPFKIGEHTVHTSVSVGVAFSNGSGLAAVDLIADADHAMYRAKNLGRAPWATLTAQAAAAATPEVSDIGHVGLTIARAERQLDDLLQRIDPESTDWHRLAQGSRALARARSVLRHEGRIG